MELESYNGELDWLNVRSETGEDSREGRGRFSFVICPSPLGHHKFFPRFFIHDLFTILLLPMIYVYFFYLCFGQSHFVSINPPIVLFLSHCNLLLPQLRTLEKVFISVK